MKGDKGHVTVHRDGEFSIRISEFGIRISSFAQRLHLGLSSINQSQEAYRSASLALGCFDTTEFTENLDASRFITRGQFLALAGAQCVQDVIARNGFQRAGGHISGLWLSDFDNHSSEAESVHDLL